MARIAGKVAFPDRRWAPPPKVGEEWEVQITGANPKGNVLFLRGVRLLSTEESRRREEEARLYVSKCCLWGIPHEEAVRLYIDGGPSSVEERIESAKEKLAQWAASVFGRPPRSEGELQEVFSVRQATGEQIAEARRLADALGEEFSPAHLSLLTWLNASGRSVEDYLRQRAEERERAARVLAAFGEEFFNRPPREILNDVRQRFTHRCKPDIVERYTDLYGRAGWSCKKLLPYPVPDAWGGRTGVEAVVVPIRVSGIVDGAAGLVVYEFSEEERQQLLHTEREFVFPDSPEELTLYEDVCQFLLDRSLADVDDFNNAGLLSCLYPLD
jgi:hypothetical protein